jgi:hypothetical protein
MDHLKLIVKNRRRASKTAADKTFCDDIRMEFGLDKCAEIVLKKGKLVHLQNLMLNINREIQQLEQGET